MSLDWHQSLTYVITQNHSARNSIIPSTEIIHWWNIYEFNSYKPDWRRMPRKPSFFMGDTGRARLGTATHGFHFQAAYAEFTIPDSAF